ncbi:MAG: hypothetical protein AAF651_06855, partial [Cyanobacteria bacterium P01_C01_bin.73]
MHDTIRMFLGGASTPDFPLVFIPTKEDIGFMSSDPLNLIEIESNDTFDTAASVPITTETPHAIAIGTIN